MQKRTKPRDANRRLAGAERVGSYEAHAVKARVRRNELARQLYLRFEQLLREQPDKGDWAARELNGEFEKLGEWVAMAGMEPLDYLRHVFIEFPAYIDPVLDAAAAANLNPGAAEDIETLVVAITSFMPSWTSPR
jgi:hypothetical protein